ncbi:MAG: AAA family ATPase [Anaerolineae bacterium]|jgi:predicted ATPase
MNEHSQHDVRLTDFEVQTNWHVITGGTCCGKTTLIDLLAEQGFQTVPETGRQVIEREVAKGRTVEEVFRDGATCARMIMDLQLRTEQRLRATDLLFLDRALPGCLPFYRHFGLDESKVLAECFHHRYASVFILDLLPLELDGARIQDEAYTVLLDEALVRCYGALGYDVVRVPVLRPQERLEFILERLSKRGLLSPLDAGAAPSCSHSSTPSCERGSKQMR